MSGSRLDDFIDECEVMGNGIRTLLFKENMPKPERVKENCRHVPDETYYGGLEELEVRECMCAHCGSIYYLNRKTGLIVTQP